MKCNLCNAVAHYRKVKLCKRCYIRLDMRKRRLNPAFRERTRASSYAYYQRNKELVHKRGRQQKRTKRKNTVKRLGNFCGFFGCTSRIRLNIHHDHYKQQLLKCCSSSSGCEQCQVCMLCYRHNLLLGMLQDDPKEARKAEKFLNERHLVQR